MCHIKQILYWQCKIAKNRLLLHFYRIQTAQAVRKLHYFCKLRHNARFTFFQPTALQKG